MEPNNKHKIFSKEEFFKRIDEKKSLPPEADEFDQEAMEGLAMITDRKKLDTLNDSIDEVLHREAAKGKRRRNIYYFSAAASLLLIVGLFFLLKENTFEKKDAGLAVNKEQQDKSPAAGTEEKPASDASVPDEKAPPAAATTEIVKKEEKGREAKLEAQLKEQAASGETFATDVTTVNAPGAGQENNLEAATKTPAFKSSGGDVKGNTDLDDKALSRGGKSDANYWRENQKNLESGQEADAQKAYKETAVESEKDKYRYQTNTVWTTPPKEDKKVSDELKKKDAEEQSKKSETANDNRSGVGVAGGITSTTNAAPVQVQQDQLAINAKDEDRSKPESTSAGNVAANEGPERSEQAHKKRKLKSSKQQRAASQAADSEKPGYAYYAQTGTRSFTSPTFTGGDEALQKFVKDNLTISSPDKSGTLVAQFTINADGSIETASIKILAPLKGCEACSKDVIELIKKMPKWQPASENGKPRAYLQKLSVPYNTAASAK